jgi:hypothetical protein
MAKSGFLCKNTMTFINNTLISSLKTVRSLPDQGKEYLMADCECLGGCPFFNDKMKDNDGLAWIYKRRYCQGDNTKCARYMVFSKLGKPAVPANLYPNMFEQAQAILAGKAV